MIALTELKATRRNDFILVALLATKNVAETIVTSNIPTTHRDRIMPQEVDFDINVTSLYAAIGRSDWEAASRACILNPTEAETWVIRKERSEDGKLLLNNNTHDNDDRSSAQCGNIMWRFLPLHSACARNPPSSFIRDLLRAYPEAAGIRDDQGMHPLHYACGNRASHGVIRHLLEAFPRAARLVDPNGMLPLHYLASWGQSERGIVDMLVEAYGEAIMARDKDGATPLELAKEGQFDGWEQVVDVMEMAFSTDRTNGGGANLGLTVVVPNNDSSTLGSTLDVRASKKSSRDSPRGRSSGTPKSSSRRTRSSSRTRADKSPSSRVRDAHSLGEISIPQSPASRGRFMETPSPRHFARSLHSLEDMKTPRSSGRGFGFDRPTPSSSGGGGGRTSTTPQEHREQLQYQQQSTFDLDPSRDNYDDQRELTKLIAEIRREKEAVEFRADAAENRAERKEAENNELRVKLSEYDHIVSNYQEAVEKLQGIIKSMAISQDTLGGIVETAEQRENSRMRKSEERRKVLMELIRSEEEAVEEEEREFQFGGDTLGLAFDKQLRQMEDIRNEVEDLRIVRDNGAHHHNPYRMNKHIQ